MWLSSLCTYLHGSRVASIWLLMKGIKTQKVKTGCMSICIYMFTFKYVLILLCVCVLASRFWAQGGHQTSLIRSSSSRFEIKRHTFCSSRPPFALYCLSRWLLSLFLFERKTKNKLGRKTKLNGKRKTKLNEIERNWSTRKNEIERN